MDRVGVALVALGALGLFALASSASATDPRNVPPDQVPPDPFPNQPDVAPVPAGDELPPQELPPPDIPTAPIYTPPTPVSTDYPTVPVDTTPPATPEDLSTSYTDEYGNTSYFDVAGNYVGYSDPDGVFYPLSTAQTPPPTPAPPTEQTYTFSVPVPSQYKTPILDAAGKYGIEPDLFARLLWQESRYADSIVFGPRVSSAGAQGIAQFMPTTATWVGQQMGKSFDPFNPTQAIPASAWYLAFLFARTNNWPDAVASYNWGLGNVLKWRAGKATPPAETQNYVAVITGTVMV